MSFQMYRCSVAPGYLPGRKCSAHQLRTSGLITSRYDEEPGQHHLRAHPICCPTEGTCRLVLDQAVPQATKLFPRTITAIIWILLTEWTVLL